MISQSFGAQREQAHATPVQQPPKLGSAGRQDPYVVFQVGTVRQRSKVKKDGGTKPAWNERVPLGQLTAAAAPQLLVEVYAESSLGKGEL